MSAAKGSSIMYQTNGLSNDTRFHAKSLLRYCGIKGTITRQNFQADFFPVLALL